MILNGVRNQHATQHTRTQAQSTTCKAHAHAAAARPSSLLLLLLIAALGISTAISLRGIPAVPGLAVSSAISSHGRALLRVSAVLLRRRALVVILLLLGISTTVAGLSTLGSLALPKQLA
jgi:hypothetical protein